MLYSRSICKRHGRLWFALVVAALCLLCSAALGAISVTVTKSGDVFLKDSRTAKKTKFMTLKDIYSGHYHAAEYCNGCVYVIRRLGWRDDRPENPDYKDELWRYDKYKHGRKLWSGQGMDFRVSPDGKVIAVASSTSSKPYPCHLYLLDAKGKMRKDFAPAGVVKGDFDFERWDGGYLWVKDQDESDILGFIRIDTRSLRLVKYPAPSGLADLDYDLNTKSLLLAYSDYPVILESDGGNRYERSKSRVNLYAYNLRAKHKRTIAVCITDLFNPKWVGSNTLEFDNPKGKGRIRRHISL